MVHRGSNRCSIVSSYVHTNPDPFSAASRLEPVSSRSTQRSFPRITSSQFSPSLGDRHICSHWSSSLVPVPRVPRSSSWESSRSVTLKSLQILPGDSSGFPLSRHVFRESSALGCPEEGQEDARGHGLSELHRGVLS